jgi:hypothetical protein
MGELLYEGVVIDAARAAIGIFSENREDQLQSPCRGTTVAGADPRAHAAPDSISP